MEEWILLRAYSYSELESMTLMAEYGGRQHGVIILVEGSHPD